MMDEFIQNVLPTFGLGGALAYVMFHFYRNDAERNAQRFAEILARQDNRYDAIIARHEKANEGWIRIVQDNTIALTRLTDQRIIEHYGETERPDPRRLP
jgi:hypothetical protein